MEPRVLAAVNDDNQKIMQMTLVLGELFFNFRIREDDIEVLQEQIARGEKEAEYWRGRFDLLAGFTSQQGMKKFMKAIETEAGNE